MQFQSLALNLFAWRGIGAVFAQTQTAGCLTAALDVLSGRIFCIFLHWLRCPIHYIRDALAGVHAWSARMPVSPSRKRETVRDAITRQNSASNHESLFHGMINISAII